MIENRILFVEGADDQHTIWAICEHFKIEETFSVEIPDSTGKINKKARPNELGGIENVFKATESNLEAAAYAVERLGIVIDADESLEKCWMRVKKILENAGYKELPDSPDANGTIIKRDFKPTFGVWIMPDNQIRGMLEDFLEFLVPDKDKNEVWTKAVKCSQEILDEIEEDKRFSKIHLSKAQIHAYLAWQNEPGKPFGTAITAKYLQADNPQCEKFVEWLKHLFVI